jgi:(R,R)-butanediol dehydrogenase/meso-butanediol dehydrogenase/diacetyl reductase
MHQVPVMGKRVVVVGIGSLGLCLVEAAQIAGAEKVLALSRSDAGRELARRAGASAAFALDRASGLDADVAFEAVGKGAGVEAAVASVRRGGHVVVLGGHIGLTPLDLLDVTVREIVLQGSVSHCFDEDFVKAAGLIDEGKLARIQRPTHFVSLEGAVERFMNGSLTGKVVIAPGMQEGPTHPG